MSPAFQCLAVVFSLRDPNMLGQWKYFDSPLEGWEWLNSFMHEGTLLLSSHYEYAYWLDCANRGIMPGYLSFLKTVPIVRFARPNSGGELKDIVSYFVNQLD